MPTLLNGYRRIERAPQFFRDIDGVLAFVKHRDDLVKITLDWTDDLDGSETISSAVYTSHGPTLSGSSTSTPNTSINVTGIGEFDIKVTTSNSRVLVETFRAYERNSGLRVNDYRP